MSSPTDQILDPHLEEQTLPRARFRHAHRVAGLLAFAFTLGGKRVTEDQGQHLVWMAFPGMLLATLLGISPRQFRWRPGVTLQLEDLRPFRRTVTALAIPVLSGVAVALISFVIIALLAAGFPAWPFTLATKVGWYVVGAVVLSVALTGIALGIAGRNRRRERRAAGWTHSKKPRAGVINAPPRAPQWKISYLAGDPRADQAYALLSAVPTLKELIPEGHVVWTLAASPRLAVIYRRWGFRQWHEKSLAMWAIAPGALEPPHTGLADRA